MGFHEELAGNNRGQAAGGLAKGQQHGQGAIILLNGFVGDGGDFAFYQCFVQVAGRYGQVEKG